MPHHSTGWPAKKCLSVSISDFWLLWDWPEQGETSRHQQRLFQDMSLWWSMIIIITTYSIETDMTLSPNQKGTTKNPSWETLASFRHRNQEGTLENLALNRTRWGDHGTNAYYHISPAIHVAQYSTMNNALGDFGYLSFVFTIFMLIEATTPPPRWRNRGHEPLVSVKNTVDKRITNDSQPKNVNWYHSSPFHGCNLNQAI